MPSAEKIEDPKSDAAPRRTQESEGEPESGAVNSPPDRKLQDDAWGRPGESPIFTVMDRRSTGDNKLLSLGGQLELPDIWKNLNRAGGSSTEMQPAALPPKEGQRLDAGAQAAIEKQSQKPDSARAGAENLELSPEDKAKIGSLVWKNESNGKVEGLTDWTNKKEPFPSLGIGHFTWLQKGQESQFGDSFRPFIKKMEEQKNPHLPAWLTSKTGNPWESAEDWQKDFNSPKMKELRDFLKNTIPEQTEHLISRLVDSRQKIVDATPEGQRQKVSERFENLLKSPEGKFALVDYVNFKGEGLKDPSSGSGWGLRHVLQNMKDTGNPVQDFSDAAKFTLNERIKNRPQDASYREGWNNRVERYKTPFSAQESVTSQKSEGAQVIKPGVSELPKNGPTPDAVKVAPGKKPVAPELQSEPISQRHNAVDKDGPAKTKEPPSKPEQVTKRAQEFELPEAVSDKSKPRDGEGYYQPLRASMKELLGRRLSDSEIKALVSGSKAVRAAAGKPINELTTADSVLPKGADEAKLFIDNIGNRRYGRQRLAENAIDNLKKELESKFGLKSDDKDNVQPLKKTDEQTVPKKPDAEKTVPEKTDAEKTVPEKTDAEKAAAEKAAAEKAAAEKAAAEKPVAEKPVAEKPVPEKAAAEKAAAEKAAAEKAAAEKAAAEKAAAEKAAAEKAAAEKAAAEKAAAEKAAAERASGGEPEKKAASPDVLASLSPKEIDPPSEGPRLKPGSFSENMSIVMSASGVAGIDLSRNAAVSLSDKVKAPAGVSAETPVAVVPGMKPGTLGVLTHRGSDGVEKQVVFIAGSLNGAKAKTKEVILNKAAAAELGIRDPRFAHSEDNGEATRTEPTPNRILAPAYAADMDSAREKQWLEKAAAAADKVDMQSYRRAANCGRGAVEALKEMGYEIPPGQEPATASDNRQVWTGARVAETLADKPGFVRVPIKDIPGGMSALPNGTFVGRYHKESAMQSRGFTMDRRFGEDPGDVDIKTKHHLPKPDGSYYRDSFAVLPAGQAEKLVGSARNNALKSEQEAARVARASEPDSGPSRAPIPARVDAVNLGSIAHSKDVESLRKEAPAKVMELASRPDVLREAEDGNEKSFPNDRAYIPRPDDKFGYRRTERTDTELREIKETLQSESDRNASLARELDAGAPDIPEKISKALEEAETKIEQIGKQQEQLSEIIQALKSGTPSSKLDARLLADLPADLARDLNLARFNRHAYDQNLAAVNNPEYNPFGMNTEKLQGNARQALAYYKAQEARALEKAGSYLQFNEDRISSQQRVVKDAQRPQEEARQLLQLHYQSKSVAAAILSANPDLVGNKHAKGAMDGRRIAVNSGHDPFHGSETPGFSGYDWSKTPENPTGMREYDFNRNTSAIFGSMVELTGGVPIYVNQDELYKQGNVAAQRMSGLAEAMAATKADIYISHHMDDDPRFKAPGTLTLVGKDAHKLGAYVNDGKGTIGVEPVRAVREQARGLQHFLPGNNVILDEMLTTFGSDRQKAMNPYEVGKLQLGVLLGMERFLNPRSNAQLSREKQRDGKAPTWEAFWNKPENKPKSGYRVMRYPDIYR